MTEQEVREIVRNFTWEFWQDLTRMAGQMVPGADMDLSEKLPHEAWENPFPWMMEAQEWLVMARYGAGLAPDEDPAEMYEICQGMVEWLFAIPGSSAYSIPDEWSDTPMGALWAMAFAKVQGDELITMAQAAEIAGVTVQAIAGRIDRGLRAYIDPSATNPQKGRRLVRRSDVEPGSTE